MACVHAAPLPAPHNSPQPTLTWPAACPPTPPRPAAFLKTLEGHPDLILATIQQRFWPTMIANYALW